MIDPQHLKFILPELVLAFFALIVCLAGVFGRKKEFLGPLSFCGIFLGLALLPQSVEAPRMAFSLLINDGLSAFFRQVSLMIGGIVILLSMGYRGLEDDDAGEYYFFILVLTASLMLAASSNHLMMIYLALESISLLSYLMAGFSKREIFSSEAGMKYFVFGAASTGIALYGISLLYGALGTLDLNMIAQAFSSGTHQPVIWLALMLVLAGFGFKCSLVPFHMWTPDVYQGAPTPVAAFFSVGPKAIGFVFVLRVFLYAFGPGLVFWPWAAGIVAVLTMTIGNLTALSQANMKRLLAYSTIAQAGYIFLGLAVMTPAGEKATLFYIFIYTLMNLGAFGAVIAVSNSLKSETMDDYAGLYKRDPLTAVVLAILLLSLAGLPPLAGFLAKFFILAAAIQAQYTVLAIIMVINTVIALFYYVKIVKFMFLREPSPSPYALSSPVLRSVLAVTAFFNILFGLWPHMVLNWLTILSGIR